MEIKLESKEARSAFESVDVSSVSMLKKMLLFNFFSREEVEAPFPPPPSHGTRPLSPGHLVIVLE